MGRQDDSPQHRSPCPLLLNHREGVDSICTRVWPPLAKLSEGSKHLGLQAARRVRADLYRVGEICHADRPPRASKSTQGGFLRCAGEWPSLRRHGAVWQRKFVRMRNKVTRIEHGKKQSMVFLWGCIARIATSEISKLKKQLQGILIRGFGR